jgi:hypothetical protein
LTVKVGVNGEVIQIGSGVFRVTSGTPLTIIVSVKVLTAQLEPAKLGLKVVDKVTM